MNDVAVTFVSASVVGSIADEEHPFAAHGTWLQVLIQDDFLEEMIADLEELSYPNEVLLIWLCVVALMNEMVFVVVVFPWRMGWMWKWLLLWESVPKLAVCGLQCCRLCTPDLSVPDLVPVLHSWYDLLQIVLFVLILWIPVLHSWYDLLQIVLFVPSL